MAAELDMCRVALLQKHAYLIRWFTYRGCGLTQVYENSSGRTQSRQKWVSADAECPTCASLDMEVDTEVNIIGGFSANYARL